MHEQIGEHALWHLPVLGAVHSDTILTTWLVMVVTLPFFWWVGKSYRQERVSRRQMVMEGLINYVADLTNGTIGKKGEPFVPFFIALFVFIFLLNEIGFFPFKLVGLPFGGAPTADINTAIAYAIMVFFVIQVSGIRKEGIAFYKHLVRPFVPMLPINVLEEVLRPTTLALRLFFNIFIGELLLFVVYQIVVGNISIGPVNLSILAAIFGPFILEWFNFLIGALQAFVFVLLSIVYLSLALADEH